MIPKIIHYCWFGRGQMPELALKCIKSWKKFCPDYEIKEWNEDNFNIKKAPAYVREAYKARKFAFVTDYVRLYAIYNEGGIYMDTDVEVIKPLERFLSHNAFSGFEDNNSVQTGIMAAEKGSTWAKDLLDYYHHDDRHFILKDGTTDMTTNVQIITAYMIKKGLVPNNSFQNFPELITFYPHDWFCPKSWATGEINLTKNTHTIHHFAGSWKKTKPYYTPKLRFRIFVSNSINKLHLRPIYNKLRGRS